MNIWITFLLSKCRIAINKCFLITIVNNNHHSWNNSLKKLKLITTLYIYQNKKKPTRFSDINYCHTPDFHFTLQTNRSQERSNNDENICGKNKNGSLKFLTFMFDWYFQMRFSYCPVKNAFTMEYDITSLINFQLMIQPAVYLISFAIAGNVPIHWYPWVHGSTSYLEWYKQIFVGNRQKGKFNWYWMQELWSSWWYWVWNQ